MQTIRRLLLLLIAAISTCFLASPTYATLLNRDLDGNGTTDAFYDSDLNITWLKNANINGVMSWFSAKAWTDSLVYGGYSDWRLPTTNVRVSGFNITSSEMGHLFYSELESQARTNVRSGDFENLQIPYGYWSGTEDGGNGAWYFYTLNGAQIANGKFFEFYALAVRPGDSGAPTQLPEPATYSLALVGVGLLVLSKSRQNLSSSGH